MTLWCRFFMEEVVPELSAYDFMSYEEMERYEWWYRLLCSEEIIAYIVGGLGYL